MHVGSTELFSGRWPVRQAAPPVLSCAPASGAVTPARFDHCGVDDLPTHRQPALRLQQCAEPSKQPFRRAGTRQLLAIQPDRLGVGHRVMQDQVRQNRMKDSRSFR